ncbi:Na+ channel, amiloride-sensitive family-containing protein [Strongyloides ratti]|uniref:Na+ channel, amiloride-sensitive family-containing protein n=1 Tax=Strongyloides ratti TaxID=34506 RepID=A0A090MYB2_STRRB|nr:Na+ channel, amiloride-sensitive family-containing protein [Strongyloides ratti]CEF66879.1 Na+ channel, amiloride-sensitive family-containing protein [Strongyloides ratti]
MYNSVILNLSDFASNTSAHGIPRAYNNKGLRRSLWLLLFSACLGAFFGQAYYLVAKFLRNDKIVSVELKFEKLEFPSVTVCNLNPYKNSLARTMGALKDTLNAFDSAISSTEKDGKSKKTRRQLPRNSSYKTKIVKSPCIKSMEEIYIPSEESKEYCYCFITKTLNNIWSCTPIGEWKKTTCQYCSLSDTSFCLRLPNNNTIGGVLTDLSSSTSFVKSTFPCICNSISTPDEGCFLSNFDAYIPKWPLIGRDEKCLCYIDNNNISSCHITSNGNDDCLCFAPKNNDNYYCKKRSMWYIHKCKDCNWNGICHKSWALHTYDICLCDDEGKCFEVKESEVDNINDNVIRIDYEIEKRHKRGLKSKGQKTKEALDLSPGKDVMVIYAKCKCEGSISCEGQKESTPAEKYNELCLCAYNQKNGIVWPCYKPEVWKNRKCTGCFGNGGCQYANSTFTKGKNACKCADIIRFCVETPPPSTNLINVEKIASNLTGAIMSLSNHSLDLSEEEDYLDQLIADDSIPKYWQISKTTTISPEIVQKEIEKEKAFGLKDFTDPIAIRAKSAENLIFAVSNLSETEKLSLGYTQTEFIKKCSFNGRQCSVENDFIKFVDPTYGNCFTFNYNKSERQNIDKAGNINGLRFEAFVNLSDYLPTTEAAGIRLTVHNPEQQPFPDTEGYSAPTGFLSSFGIKLKKVKRLPAPYGDCYEGEKNEDYIYRDKEYSTEGCIRTCLQKSLVKACGCGDPRFPQYMNDSNCPVNDPIARECLKKEIKRSISKESCNCRQPCLSLIYSVTYSSSRWPSGINFRRTCEEGLTPLECLNFYREQGAMIEVFFEQLNYEALEESEAYALPNLISDFGGQLGLFLGCSVITIMEVGILCVDLLVTFFGYLCKFFKNKKNPEPKLNVYTKVLNNPNGHRNGISFVTSNECGDNYNKCK